MYSIRKEFIKFITYSDYCVEKLLDKDVYKIMQNDQKKLFIFSSGFINSLWQAWNRFWRTYWLANIFGGVDIHRNWISPQEKFISENDSVLMLSYLLKNRKIPKSFQQYKYITEPTWGSEKVLFHLSNIYNLPGSKIINVLGVYSKTIKHFQIVRNVSIHLSGSSINELINIVSPYYIISKINYPTDILFSKRMPGKKIAIMNWKEELVAFIKLVTT